MSAKNSASEDKVPRARKTAWRASKVSGGHTGTKSELTEERKIGLNDTEETAHCCRLETACCCGEQLCSHWWGGSESTTFLPTEKWRPAPGLGGS